VGTGIVTFEAPDIECSAIANKNWPSCSYDSAEIQKHLEINTINWQLHHPIMAIATIAIAILFCSPLTYAQITNLCPDRFHPPR
jgi:hypothetical protein